MEFINEAERIASIHLHELTAGQAEIFFNQFKDSPLSELTVLYADRNDLLLLNRDSSVYDTVRQLVLDYMALPENEKEKLRYREDMPDMRKEIYEVIDAMILKRNARRNIFILRKQDGNILPESMEKAICSQCGGKGYLAMCYAYRYGIIQGKREERARRKRGAGA